MDSFLERHRSGQLVEPGVFTLSPEKAREKHRQYQLLTGDLYPLKLVQAAVAAGSSGLQVETGAGWVAFEFAGGNLPPAELIANLYREPHRLTESVSRHLVFAILGAFHQGCIKAQYGGLTLTPEGSQLQEDSSFRGVVLEKKRNWFSPLFSEEVEKLRDRARFPPLAMTVDGAALERTVWPQEPLLDDLGLPNHKLLYEKIDSQGKGLFFPRPPLKDCSPGMSRHFAVAEGGPALLHFVDQPGVLVEGGWRLAIFPGWEAEGRLWLVYHGVVVEEMNSVDLGHPGAWLIATSEALKTSLSGLEVVRDEAFNQQLEQWRALIRGTTESVPDYELRQGLKGVGLEGAALEMTTRRTHRWMTQHRITAASVEEAVWLHLPGSMVEHRPALSKRKVEGARQTHADHLPAEEEILALYDDTVLGNGKRGLVVTSNRLCWRNVLESPAKVLWSELEEATETSLGVELGEVSVSICTADLRGPAVAFFNSLRLL